MKDRMDVLPIRQFVELNVDLNGNTNINRSYVVVCEAGEQDMGMDILFRAT